MLIKFQGRSWNLQLRKTFSLRQATACVNKNFNLSYGSHVKKRDTRLLIGRITFLTYEKSDTRHLIALHGFANENLLCGFPVCRKSQYVYNNGIYNTQNSQQI